MRLQRCQTGAVMSIAKFRRFLNRVQVKPVGENSEERGFSMQFMKMAVWEFSQHFCDYPSTTRDEAKTPTEFPCTPLKNAVAAMTEVGRACPQCAVRRF